MSKPDPSESFKDAIHHMSSALTDLQRWTITAALDRRLSAQRRREMLDRINGLKTAVEAIPE